MSSIPISNLEDQTTDKQLFIDTFRNLKVANTKRIVGANFASTIETTYMYTVTTANGGTVTASNGEGTLATNTTANGTASLITKSKIRHLSGRANLIRIATRFGDTGGTNNVREFGIYVDANNQFVFRLTGTTFCVSVKRAGIENTVNSGSFNGTGVDGITNGTWTVDTNFHRFEIMYSSTRISFIIDDEPIHTFRPTTSSLTGSLVGSLYASNTNSGGSTTSRNLVILTWSGSQIGDAVNNPMFYNLAGVAETRTLKGGGGTLQAISVGRLGGANASLTIYDNTAGTGTIIGTWDLTKDQAIGTHNLGAEGVNFNNGLSYVSSGTMTNASVTFFWE